MMSRVPFNKSFLSLCLLSTFSSFGFAEQAEQAEQTDIEKIEVINHHQAYRGNVAAKDLPQATSVISSQQLSDIGIVSFQTALSLESSIARQNNFGGLWESFAVRGFAGDENLPSSYLINGFSAGRGFSGVRDISNIESIEVLKGPGSALYGRGEPGGTINIITKKPQFQSEGYLKLYGAKHQYQRYEGDYTTGVTDEIAVRINGAYEESESFRNTVESEKLALSPSVYFQINDETRLTYELEYVKQEIPFDRGIPVLPGVKLSPETFLGEPNDGPMEVDAIGHQLTLNHDINEDWFFTLGAGYRDSSLEGFSTETELSPGRQLLYVDGETISRQRRYRDYDAKDLSFRAELSGVFNAMGFSNNMLLGMDSYDYELHSQQERWRVGWGSGDTTYSINAENPVYGQTPPALSPTTDNIEEQHAWGVYVQDLVNVTEKFDVLIGLRYDKFEQDITNNFSSNVASQSKSEFSPRIGLSYKLTDDVALYSNYAEGFRPNSGADANGSNFAPEKSKSMEAGLKWSANNDKLFGTIAVFRTEKSNILTADPVNSGFSTALGKAESTGIELDVIAMLSEDTEFVLSYAYVDAHTVNDMVNPDWGVEIPAGSQLINVPEQTVNVTLQHYTEIAGKELQIGAHIQHVSDRLGETTDPSYELPSYTITNLFSSLTLSEHLTIQASIENLFDEAYFANSYSALWTMPGQPMRYQASLTYQF